MKKLKCIFLSLLLLLPISTAASDNSWNFYETKAIPPNGKYSDWVATFSEDGKYRTGFVWIGNEISFGSHSQAERSNFDLRTRRDFGDYSVITTFLDDGNRYAAVRIGRTELSLVFQMTETRKLVVYLSSTSQCDQYARFQISIDGRQINDTCDIDHELVRNAEKMSVIIDNKIHNVSVLGSGASIIWLNSFGS